MPLKRIILYLAIGFITGAVSMWYISSKDFSGGTVTTENKQTDTVKTITSKKSPDGTVETVTKIVRSKKESAKTVVPNKAKWAASIGASTDFRKQGNELYKFEVSRRFGDSPFWGGVYGDTSGQYGISIRAEF